MKQISELSFDNLESFFSKGYLFESIEFNGLGLNIIRDDKLHPIISGNKFRKLYPFLKLYRDNGFESIESMGGSFSNHLHALAYACASLKIPLKVYCPIPLNDSSETIKDAKKWGAVIEEVSREKFRELRLNPIKTNAKTLWIPEGAKGIKQEFPECPAPFKKSKLWVSSGTGSTAMALNTAEFNTHSLLAVKDKSVEKMLQQNKIHHYPPYSIAKFGKTNPEILNTSKAFFESTGILLDPIYNSKSLHFLTQNQLLKDGDILYHCGGLQGWNGFKNVPEANFAIQALNKH